ncbi:hypothetical protein C8Q75DRAFT_530315 [Abortiporus biennis]|nr:hypothetical protein C8Q75DRAFT_530315 [Abortiporus biennis]
MNDSLESSSPDLCAPYDNQALVLCSIARTTLSPTSGLYGALWPIIISQADYFERLRTLCFVNKFFAQLCDEIEPKESHKIKRKYVEEVGNPKYRSGLPVSIYEPAYNRPWGTFTFQKLKFYSSDTLTSFFALGSLNPSSSQSWKIDYRKSFKGAIEHPWYYSNFFGQKSTYIWISEDKDLILESDCNPIYQDGPLSTGCNSKDNRPISLEYGFVVGVEEKVKRMFDFVVSLGSKRLEERDHEDGRLRLDVRGVVWGPREL